MGEDWRSAWVAALDALEADVETVEQMIESEHRERELAVTPSWAPPPTIGPLPAELRPRADAILSRQIAAAQQLSGAITTNRRQAAFAARVEVGTAGRATSSYVDCAM